VLDFTRDLQQLHATLQLYTGTLKLSLLFDGLGHLCASIFIHSAQWMTRLSGDGRKRLCRQILAVQKCLGRLTQRPEKELLRAQHYYDLLAEEPDSLLGLPFYPFFVAFSCEN
jgi:hypothetical protein